MRGERGLWTTASRQFHRLASAVGQVDPPFDPLISLVQNVILALKLATQSEPVFGFSVGWTIHCKSGVTASWEVS
jgi:hypothetical protein